MLKTMMGAMANTAFARIDKPSPPAHPTAKRVLAQMSEEFLAAPPLTMHAGVPELMAVVWATFRESMLAGPTDRVAREAVAGAVSVLNDCPYCVDVHTAMVSAGGAHAAVEAIRTGDADEIERADLRELVRWARATRTPGDPALASPPFDEGDRPYIVGTALGFHYVNRMVNTFLESSPMPAVPGFVRRATGTMTRMSAMLFNRTIGVRTVEPGASLSFVGSAELPAELEVLGKATAVRTAWAAACAAAERAGEVLDPPVREVVGARIEAWDGADAPMGRGWVDEAVAELGDDQRPGARLALLAGLGAYQVDEEVTDAARAVHGSDEALVSIAGWASVRAVRRIASWL